MLGLKNLVHEMHTCLYMKGKRTRWATWFARLAGCLLYPQSPRWCPDTGGGVCRCRSGSKSIDGVSALLGARLVYAGQNWVGIVGSVVVVATAVLPGCRSSDWIDDCCIRVRFFELPY